MRKALLAVLLLLSPAVDSVLACPACQGDPDSEMTKAAARGVIVLGIIVYGVLFGMGGLAITWFVRARRLAAIQDPDE